MKIKQLMVGVTLMASTIGGFAGQAKAHEIMLPGAAFSIACDNGGSYVLQSRPVLAPGDIVTAKLFLNPRHAIPVRLIPMGNGYRYAGPGVWLDGINDQALLYLRKYQPIPCVVSRI